jgi:hypothetical protein
MLRALCLVLAFPVCALAQDMPLFTWAKNGEGWTKGEDQPRVDLTPEINEDLKTPHVVLKDPITKKSYLWKSGESDSGKDRPDCCVVSKDGGTLFVGFGQRRAVWVYQVDKDGLMLNGDAYAPLRIRQGYDNSKESLAKLKNSPPTVSVVSLTRDSVGRIYALTSLGVQVFDPTGRPSGVLSLPVKANPTHMAWSTTSKAKLKIWIDDQVWERELLTERP